MAAGQTPAMDGDLDPTFGHNGKLTVDLGSSRDYLTGLAIQTDGKIVAAGASAQGIVAPIGTAGPIGIARFHSDGSPDLSFGFGGRTFTDFVVAFLTPVVAIQTDGKILVGAGAPDAQSGNFVLVRYNGDGSLDRNFGVAGRVITDFGFYESISSLTLMPNGKILAGGVQSKTPQSRFFQGDVALARYNPDGSLDATFGTAGKIVNDFGHSENAAALAVQPDGKILVAGGSALARYNANGTLDTSFGARGGFTDFPHAHLSSVAVQSDGKIVVAGGLLLSGDPSFLEDFFVARFHSNGLADTSFGNNGEVRTSFAAAGQDSASDLAIQADGKIVVAGSAGGPYLGCDEGYPGAPDFALARYNTNGSLDTSFGTDGKVITNFVDDSVSKLAIQTDGKILAAGSAFDLHVSGGNSDFALARYHSDGSLPVTGLRLEPGTVRPGGSFTASFSGPDLTSSPYFDLRFRPPGSDTDEVALNWQLGPSAPHTVPHDVLPGTWTVTGVRAHRNIKDQTRFIPVTANLTVMPRLITGVLLAPADVQTGASFTATFVGANLSDNTYLDIRFRRPGRDTDEVVVNWQRGKSVSHSVPGDTEPGTWTITGVRAHEVADDHSTEFEPVSASLIVRPRVSDSRPDLRAFFNELEHFNAAVGDSVQQWIDFENIASNTDITGATIAGVTFKPPSVTAFIPPLRVVRGSDTFTPSGFEGVLFAEKNKLFATSGLNVLSPGGVELAQDPIPWWKHLCRPRFEFNNDRTGDCA
jgi:uncharacterized delta-60 repeat protein